MKMNGINGSLTKANLREVCFSDPFLLLSVCVWFITCSVMIFTSMSKEISTFYLFFYPASETLDFLVVHAVTIVVFIPRLEALTN